MAGKYSKQEILVKGMNLIREQGYSNTGVNDILKVCGIPKGSFYNFFRSKDDFGFQTIELYTSFIKNMYDKFEVQTELSPVEKITGFFELSNENFRKEGCQLNCLLLSISNEITETRATFAVRVFQAFEKFKAYLVRWIEEGQKQGTIRDHARPRELADYLYDGYHGAIIRMKFQRNCESLDSFVQHHLKFIFT